MQVSEDGQNAAIGHKSQTDLTDLTDLTWGQAQYLVAYDTCLTHTHSPIRMSLSGLIFQGNVAYTFSYLGCRGGGGGSEKGIFAPLPK